MNKLISLLISCSVVFTFGMTSAFAEYYVVYPGPYVVCDTCYRPHYRVVHKYHVKKVKKKKHYRHRVRCYSGCCGCAAPAYVAPCDGGYYRDGYWEPTRYYGGYYIERSKYDCPGYYRRDYNPDMTTGDDNVCANPDMDINE